MTEPVNTFFILSLDPGTINTGYGLIEVDIETLNMVSAKAWTINASKLTNDDDWDVHLYDDRFARINQQCAKFRSYLKEYDPLIVVCESPFYNPGRPNAFGALLEVVLKIRETLYRWDRWMTLNQIDPATAKKGIGVPGNSGDKGLVKKKLLELKDFQDIGLEDFDEHSADALLIAKCQLERLRAGDR